MTLYHVETVAGGNVDHILPWGKGRVYCGRAYGDLRRARNNKRGGPHAPRRSCKTCSRALRAKMGPR